MPNLSPPPSLVNKQAGDHVWNKWFEEIYQAVLNNSGGGGGSAKEYASFYMATGGTTGISGTAVTLVLDQTSVNSNGSVFSLASNQVTVNKTGDFKFSIDVYVNLGGNSRTEYSIWLERGGSEIAGTRSAIYNRGYDSGQSASINKIISVTSGDVFQIRAQRTDGGGSAGYQDDNGTRFVVEEK